MNRYLVFLLGALAGLVVGIGIVFFMLGGVPRSAKAPGEPIKAPDPNGAPGGTATVVLNQDFFNTVLTTIFRDMNAPSFPLGMSENKLTNTPRPGYALFDQATCDDKITLVPEGSGVKTALRFDKNQIMAPLAFSGNKNLFGFGCVAFTGWAEAKLDLNFDSAQQTVFGAINIQTVNLDGVAPFVGGFVTPVVQTTLNNRVNPIVILRGQQIALNVPIAATSSALQAQVKDVRSEIKDNALYLYVTYDFKGTKTQGQPAV
jgi:hypothetical protein